MTKRCCKCERTLPRSEFYKNNGRPDGMQTVCKGCTRLNNQAWRAANPDAHLRHYAAYQLTDDQREARRLRAKAWLEANPNRARENSKRWNAKNPEKARKIAVQRAATRKARLLGAFVEYVDPARVFERSGGICGICGAAVRKDDFHVDHVIPLSRGGEHSYANVQIAHPTCNRKKWARLPGEIRMARRLLIQPTGPVAP